VSESEQLKLARTNIILAKMNRQEGNEGKARVCARRAAGYLVLEYFQRIGYPDPGSSAILRLKILKTFPNLSIQIYDIVDKFLVHVTPEHEHPERADLIEATYLLARLLLDEPL
jgi:hypothetical protein